VLEWEEDLLEDLEDLEAKVQDCIETLKNGKALDEMQLAFAKVQILATRSVPFIKNSSP
jgi:hypothetical protein